MSTAPPAPGSVRFEALGGTAVVLTSDPAAVGQAAAVVRAEVAAVDAACSRFRDDSDLSRVNAANGRPVTVGELFALALDAALRAAELTGGDVDPTCGASLAAVGYDRDFARLADRQIVVTGFAPAPGWQSVEWDRERRRVRIPAGSRLDFGATAKALAADRAADRARSAAGCGVLVSLSGDIATSGAVPEGGWRVLVTDDHRSGPDAPGQTITLAGGALATSGTTVRRWMVADVSGRDLATPAPTPRAEHHVMHHILQPRTGQPAESCWRTVSVAAATCLDANTAATAALIRGTAAIRWLTAAGLPSRLVRHDGSAVTIGGWPADQAGPACAPGGHR